MFCHTLVKFSPICEALDESFGVLFTVCAVSLFGASAEIKVTVPVGKLFTYELMRETFQSDFEPLSKLYGRRLDHVNSLFSLVKQRFQDI